MDNSVIADMCCGTTKPRNEAESGGESRQQLPILKGADGPGRHHLEPFICTNSCEAHFKHSHVPPSEWPQLGHLSSLGDVCSSSLS